MLELWERSFEEVERKIADEEAERQRAKLARKQERKRQKSVRRNRAARSRADTDRQESQLQEKGRKAEHAAQDASRKRRDAAFWAELRSFAARQR